MSALTWGATDAAMSRTKRTTSGVAFGPNPLLMGRHYPLDLAAQCELPETLKAAIEIAADKEGISTNAWLVKTIAHSLESSSSRRGKHHRLQGYAQG